VKTKILAVLTFMAIVAIQSQLIAFAAEPPGLSSPFSDPPSLGDDDDTDPPSLDDGSTPADDTPADDTPADDSSSVTTGGGSLPVIGNGDDDDDTGGTSGTGSGTTGGTSGTPGSTGGISETGPAAGVLLIPSLILGYAFKKVSKK
jgi:hypothetical protein